MSGEDGGRVMAVLFGLRLAPALVTGLCGDDDDCARVVLLSRLPGEISAVEAESMRLLRTSSLRQERKML